MISGSSKMSGGADRTGTSPLQAIYDGLCTLNVRISALGSTTEITADGLVGARQPSAETRGPVAPPNASRIGQMQDLLSGLHDGMSNLESQFSRIQEAL